MTAVEWFAIQLGITNGTMLEKAKEMEKQQIIDAHLTGLITSLETEATKQATEYYNDTYGSKGSDSSINSTLNSTLNSSSQTEISDEEIEKAADKYVSEDEFNRLLECFEEGAKWYREQLKKKQ